MSGLIVKDICLMKGQVKFLLAVMVIAVFLSFNSDGTFAASYLVMITAFLGISTISYDETENGYAFLFCLPVSRRQYVAAKYLFNLLIGFAGWIVGIFITVGVYLVQPGEAELAELLFSNLVFVPVLFLIQALMQPTMFRYGSERGRIALFIMVGAIIAVCYLIGKIFELGGIDLATSLNGMSNLSAGMLVLAFTLAAVVIWLLSVPVSMGIIRKKEF